jgi:hypothetical protein
MKLLITESQLNRLVEDQHYLNSLLDKISDEGIESLTPEERNDLEMLSRGEELPKPKLPFDKNTGDEDSDVAEGDEVEQAYHLFFKYILDDDTVETEIGVYHTELVESDGEKHLLVTNGEGNTMYVTPFYNGLRGINVFTKDKRSKEFKLKVIPKDDIEMMEFIEKFISTFLPKIIMTMYGS